MDCRSPPPNNARAPPGGAPEGGRTVGDHRGGRVRGQRAWPRRLRLVTVLLAAVMMPGLVAVPAGAGLLPPLLPPPSPPLKVIVQQLDPNDPPPAVLVSLLGGKVTEQLPIVTGLPATIPLSLLTQIPGLPGVRAISGTHQVVPTAAVKIGIASCKRSVCQYV